MFGYLLVLGMWFKVVALLGDTYEIIKFLFHVSFRGNAIGDIGARLLAKALQINTNLRFENINKIFF